MKQTSFKWLCAITIIFGLFAAGCSGVIVASRPAETSVPFLIAAFVIGIAGYILSNVIIGSGYLFWNVLTRPTTANKFLGEAIDASKAISTVAIFCVVMCGLFKIMH